MTFLELEKKCKKRRLLKNIKILFLLLTILIAIYFYYKFFFKDIKKIEEVKENNISKNEKIIQELPTLKLFLDLNITNDKNETKEIEKDKKVSKNKEVNKSIGNEKVNDKNVTNSFIKATTLPSFDECILLANKYYKEGNYKEALKWAKNANVQDNQKEISWILSAKILNKMGKKKEAIKLLKLYYNYNKDEKVKKLMEQLSE